MRLTTPIAVLLGLSIAGLLTAVAVFFALRANHADIRDRLAALPPPEQGEARRTVETPTVVANHPGNAHEEAVLALNAQHDRLVEACFTQLAKSPPQIPSISFHVRVGFDAEGKQATKTELIPRTLARLDIADCVAKELEPMQIPKGVGPGTVDIILSMP